MKFESLERVDIDPLRILLVAALSGAAVFAFVQVLTGSLLGGAAFELSLASGGTVAYMVVTIPRRAIESQAFLQAQEAPTLAVLASAIFGASNSRARTMLMLRAEEEELSKTLTRIKRAIILGHPISETVDSLAPFLASYSAADVLGKAARLSTESIEESDQERGGISKGLEMEEETKLPLFITACFFVPILLMIFAAFSHIGDPKDLAVLLGLQTLLVDLAFYFTSSGRGRKSV